MLPLEDIGIISTDKLSYITGDIITINWSNVNFIGGAIKIYDNNGHIKHKLCIDFDSGYTTYNITADDEIGNWWADLVNSNDTIVNSVLFNVTHICTVPIANIVFA